MTEKLDYHKVMSKFLDSGSDVVLTYPTSSINFHSEAICSHDRFFTPLYTLGFSASFTKNRKSIESILVKIEIRRYTMVMVTSMKKFPVDDPTSYSQI